MEQRHESFRDAIGFEADKDVLHVRTAAEAILALMNFKFDQVFLDHDLSEDDIMVDVGRSSKVPTGMAVVDHILTMDDPPPDIIIHSCNEPASIEMDRRLSRLTGVQVRRVAFPYLLKLISG